MKTYIITFAVMIFTLASCKAQTPQSNSVEETEITFLVDCTDKFIFEDVYTDFHDNFAVFFKNLGVGQLNSNEKLTLKIGAIDDSDRLSLKSASIVAASSRASKREQEARCNPRPLLQLITTELDNQKKRCERDNKNSPIIDVVLKTFRDMNSDASREVVVICTDGLENNYVNLYRNIPENDEGMAKVMKKMDVVLLNEAKEKISEVDPEVIFVLKANPKANTAKLKVFYTKLMKQLGVNTVSFIDNLSNSLNL